MEVSYLHRLSAQSIRTQAYPGFHTDIQPLHAALMLMARGSSRIEETILNGRFKYAEELRKMGASATIEEASFTCVNGKAGQILKIKGVNRLSGSTLTAPDIRGGAALVLAAMAAEGVSTIQNIYQIERGYGNMAEIFSKLGASIQRLGHIQKTA
jgi:UDP-N-acetylglucosamine 1-carboxyvinyltransferase